MKKTVLKLDLRDDKGKQKAFKAVSSLSGIDSIAIDMKEKKLTVTGDIDPVTVVGVLRKVCHTEILTVGPAKDPEKKKEEPKKDDPAKKPAGRGDNKDDKKVKSKENKMKTLSHHISRRGQFQLNYIFAVLNAVPAIALISYGVLNNGFLPGLCFGAGLGITVLGMAYVCVHDGLIHSRFAVGPIADVPYLRRVAVAYQFHHSNKFRGVPYGFFLGPKEIEDAGGLQELDREKWES